MTDTPIRISEDRPEAVAASAFFQERLIEAAWELRWAHEVFERPAPLPAQVRPGDHPRRFADGTALTRLPHESLSARHPRHLPGTRAHCRV
ncbi:hypothetical protein ACFWIB_35035 [Streptomyces sp. NPDC127051]|uniref:hypothetical protein n=1 Tax=Streptomyces sp. NPDC127051 TaxID=3347119 RepID=UPI00366A01C1